MGKFSRKLFLDVFQPSPTRNVQKSKSRGECAGKLEEQRERKQLEGRRRRQGDKGKDIFT